MSALINTNNLNVKELLVVVLSLTAVLTLSHLFYNGFLHPLRDFPGPISHSMAVLPRAVMQFRGRLPLHVADLHRRYGTVVRIAPNELTFSSPQAWRDIYGYKPGQEEFPKYRGFYKIFAHIPTTIVNADTFEHGRLRRHLAPAFGDRSMRAQEPIVASYVDLLILRLKEAVQKDSYQNMLEWYTWATFDIIGDLSFGVEGGFGCLTNISYHPWVKLIKTTIVQNGRILALIELGFRKPLAWLHQLAGKVFAEYQHRLIVKEKVLQRMNGAKRPDFLDNLIRNKELLNLDAGRLATNASVLVVAGSETTATLLCGVTYFLTTNIDILQKVQHEVRSSFKGNEEITLTSVGNLHFMLACLNEALRRYPPVATGAPRVTHKDAVIDGRLVPKGTIVSVFQYAVNHDERYWKEPNKFLPERWMGDPTYESDQLDAMQSFSVGPRNCIGRNLAYAEMRLILAKLIYNFDLTLADESHHWISAQRVWSTWDKPPLRIHLHPLDSINSAD
ncbi:putative cytochrome P450 [Xylaria bambusicola]|uniref:putative cytochrome P450 n=1 Tax=Xylaria bambusicola TaxID=326684 RepID=UPI0020076B8B|nr:putative cytochrome P450 [Xylaria bambusicola]KAI0517835.1 putative cytochrome P450 [Xylaria bambusicola]